MLNIAFVMDLGLLVLLAATVVLVFKLNLNLRHFRESRFEMEGLVNRLTVNVERAEKAIAGLQVSARNSGADIDKKIKESKFLADELKFMNDAGNNLATRLEKLAETNRALIEKMEQSGGIGPNISHPSSKIILPESAQKTMPAQAALQDMDFPAFAIMDREYDEEAAAADDLADLDFALENHASNLQSQAEREFFEALQKRKAARSRN
jgi:hypothetical protein